MTPQGAPYFKIVFHIYYYWLISWYYSTIIHQWIGFWWHGQNNQNMTAARRDSSSFSCGVLSDFCSALGLLHDAGLSAKRGASSSNCTATWMTWRVGTNGTRKWVIVYWCLLWTPPFLGVFWQVHDSHACTFDGCRVDCFFPLLLWLLAATTCGLNTPPSWWTNYCLRWNFFESDSRGVLNTVTKKEVDCWAA